MAYSSVTLTGTFNRLDGTPADGSATVTASRRVVAEGVAIMDGPVRVPLTAGRLEVDLPASDDPRLGEPFTYTVVVAMGHAHWSTAGLVLPATAGTVDLSDIPDDQVVHYLNAGEVDAAIAAAIAAHDPVTITTTAPATGLWANPNEEI